MQLLFGCVLLILIYSQSTLSLPLCKYNINCKECQLCNINDISEGSSYCNYENLFCISYSFEAQIFKPSTINEYSNILRNDNDINNFCGKETITIRPNEKEETISIFNTKDKTFPKNKKVHCNFNITKEEEKKLKDIILYFEITNKDNSNNHNLAFNITFINLDNYGYYNVPQDIVSFNDEKIRNEKYEHYFEDNNKIQILIDFNDMTSTITDENFEIRLNYKTKNSFELLYEILIGIVGLIFLVVIIICLCKFCAYKKVEIDQFGNRKESVDICIIY